MGHQAFVVILSTVAVVTFRGLQKIFRIELKSAISDRIAQEQKQSNVAGYPCHIYTHIKKDKKVCKTLFPWKFHGHETCCKQLERHCHQVHDAVCYPCN